MIRGLRGLALATWLAAGSAAASSPAPTAYLSVTDPGCGGGIDAPPATRWETPGYAVHTLTVWMNSRESIRPGPVEVDVDAARVVAWVPVLLEEVAPGEPVATCIRPVSLSLGVSPLAEGDYAWELRRGTRAEEAARTAAAGQAPDAAD